MKKKSIWKIIGLIIILLLVIFLLCIYMVNNNQKYMNKLEKKIIKNTDVKVINYLNYYDNYYIVDDSEYIYLFDEKYIELLKEDKVKFHENTNNYDIIYKDKQLMYLDSVYKKGKVKYIYYDMQSYEEIKSTTFGG